MSLDIAKYRDLFLDEAREHLGELSGALLSLEKDPTCVEAIDLAFRMAHSIKGMAASLGYDAITDLAHKLEDRMETYRAAGAVESGGISLLFRGLDGLERMVAVVAATGEGPEPDPALSEALSPTGEVDDAPEVSAPPKKVPRRP